MDMHIQDGGYRPLALQEQRLILYPFYSIFVGPKAWGPGQSASVAPVSGRP